jgi:hypothetical protein
VGYKSRALYTLGDAMPDEQWDKVFGDTKCKVEVDLTKPLTKVPKDEPKRGDYGLCRQTDKILTDFVRFKEPEARKKIEAEYYGIQKEGRSKQLHKI